MRLLLRRSVVVAAWCVANGQDPLGGEAFYPVDPPRWRPPPSARGGQAPTPMRPNTQAAPWFGRLGFLAAGAATMRMLDLRKERKLQRRLEATTTSLEFKKVEAQQLDRKLRALQYQVSELRQALYESEAEAYQRDYDEFKAPDADDDDYISADEFFSYIHNYMKAYPNIPEDEYPTFRDFDKDNSGAVTFNEWQAYLQQQQEAKKDTQKKASDATAKAGAAPKKPPLQQQHASQQQRR